MHVADRERLLNQVEQLGLQEKVAVQPGADEVAMLLLARALTKRFNYSPRIMAVYSSEKTRSRVMPYEDRPLHRTVSFHIAAAGGRETERASDADAFFYVYASRREKGVAAEFARGIAQAEATGRRVILADVDPIGDVQGGDPVFTEALRKQNVFPRLSGYAAWNTAGNTIGTALPHGIVYLMALERLANKSQASAYRIGVMQTKFLMHRLLDDYVYHSLVRPAAKKLAAERNLNANNLTGENRQQVESFIRERVQAYVPDLSSDFARRPVTMKLRLLESFAVVPRAVDGFKLGLPWGRTFEAEIDFSLKSEQTNVMRTY